MRFDKPIGTALLWYPVAWSLWLSSQGLPSLRLFTLFLLGTITMRAAGCVINDIADRQLDAHVARTKKRPLATGQLTLQNALVCFSILLSIALFILIHLPPYCFLIALIAALFTALYPFTKRWFDMPQLILGLAFTSSVPMVFEAVEGQFSLITGLLMALNICWVVAYDTAYAMVDRDDDLLMQMHSSAILFGRSDRYVIGVLQIITHGLWLPIAWLSHFDYRFYIIWFVASLFFIHQQRLLYDRRGPNCFAAFLNNHWYGLVMWVALIVAFI
jgi:4-hydroxybenzoate polyprenyltransferase